MCIEYASLRGSLDGMDLTAITEIAEYFEYELDQEISPRTPFVGRNFNATRAEYMPTACSRTRRYIISSILKSC